MEKKKLVIGHFYPDLLNLYGDRGNVLALYRRALLRGIDVEVRSISVGDTLDPSAIDIAFLGGGQDVEQNIMKDDLVYKKGDLIKQMIEDGQVLLGRYYLEHTGEKLECLGAIDYYTEAKKERFINDTVYEFDGSDGKKVTVVGFENHSGRTYLGSGVKPFMRVVEGHGNNGEDGYEGAVYKNTFCTYSHGSLLPKNPEITDMLIGPAMKNRYGEGYVLEPLDDSKEQAAKSAALHYIRNGKEQMI